MSITPRAAARSILDAARGSLIGFAEVVPGISGGTVALIVGVYDTLIDGAGHLARGVARLVSDGLRGRGTAGARAHFGKVHWAAVLPIGIGMLAAILVGAALIAPLLDEHPTETRAVFFGLIVASLIVPIRMVGGRWKAHEYLIAAAGAAFAFLLTDIPRAPDQDPTFFVILISAAVAICALVLPGVSGSYLLLTVGMYAPTLAAVNDRDLAYLGTFILGAILGLGVFVSGLQWLLAKKRRVTLIVITGLMLGSLRALWPWQEDDGSVLPAESNWPIMIGLAVIGAVVILALIALERMLVARKLMSEDVVSDPSTDSIPTVGDSR
ncbi:DUF368 domain-containing protein [Microcella alkaliphila]|uniref:Putative membrane protein n=1 Tax=Microcella alkaliphila TaxID=279828 RepID=A0A0U4WVI7_9MICO|nr:DUF368 domain-containing protein [Microcella alkaliphila]BAU31847.1 putative membrane protein [Microcella alkaliphila]